MSFKLLSLNSRGIRSYKIAWRYLVEASVKHHPFLFVNVAPTKQTKKLPFPRKLSDELDNFCLAVDCNLIIGGFSAQFNGWTWRKSET